jgi:hypothetical protein
MGWSVQVENSELWVARVALLGWEFSLAFWRSCANRCLLRGLGVAFCQLLLWGQLYSALLFHLLADWNFMHAPFLHLI